MKKKIGCIVTLILLVLLYRMPQRIIVQCDSLASYHAHIQAQHLVTYAFEHYTDLNTIDTYLKKHMPWIKKASYIPSCFKEYTVKLWSNIPLFLVERQWVIADNNCVYEANYYRDDIVRLLTAVGSDVPINMTPYPLLIDVPLTVVEQYDLYLTSKTLIARSKQYPNLEFIAQSADNFDVTLSYFNEILRQEARFKNAMRNNKRVTVDTRFHNQYVVCYQA